MPEESGVSPAVLLLHGATHLGRKSGLIVLLGHYFQQAGWIVLAPDARGFGDSVDPADIDSPDSWNPEHDIRRCIDYLYSLLSTDKDLVFVIGHSMGAGHALEFANKDPRIKAMVLICPPSHINGIQDSFWQRIKFSAVRGLNDPIASNVYLVRSRKADIQTYLDGFLSRTHLPVLLVGGEREGMLNRDYLSRIAENVSQPFEYLTLKKLGHYCGVYNHPFTGTVYYRPDAFQPFFAFLMDYLNARNPAVQAKVSKTYQP